jgi:large subunit ribosomal protein L36e
LNGIDGPFDFILIVINLSLLLKLCLKSDSESKELLINIYIKMSNRTGIFVGLNKGFVVTKPKVNTRKLKPSYKKGKLGKRVQLIREVIREVVGLAPYERKMIEMIRTGVAIKEKKAVKLARRRLGTQKRAQNKRDEINEIIRTQKKK